jgi:hypothetical protein
MNSVKQVIGINLIIMFLYLLGMSRFHGGSPLLEVAPWVIIMHAVINFAIAASLRKTPEQQPKAYALSGLVILVIGFPACFGIGLISISV